MIHELKIYPEYFKGVVSGVKTFEIRKDDRPYKVGDLLALNEYDGQHYTGNSCLVYIDYILANTDYVREGMVVMSIKPCYVERSVSPYNPAKMANDYAVPLVTRAEK